MFLYLYISMEVNKTCLIMSSITKLYIHKKFHAVTSSEQVQKSIAGESYPQTIFSLNFEAHASIANICK